MKNLILVKHSHPEIIPTKSANEWRLSATGQARCLILAEQLAPFSPDVIISSVEPKAVETAQIAAEQLNLSAKTVDGLHEHDRVGVGYLDRETFESAVTDFFEQPDQLVFGNETANHALERYLKAVQSIEREYPNQNIVIVSHGTVMTLFVKHFNQIEPFTFWGNLGLPSFVVLSHSEHKLKSPIENID